MPAAVGVVRISSTASTISNANTRTCTTAVATAAMITSDGLEIAALKLSRILAPIRPPGNPESTPAIRPSTYSPELHQARQTFQHSRNPVAKSSGRRAIQASTSSGAIHSPYSISLHGNRTTPVCRAW